MLIYSVGNPENRRRRPNGCLVVEIIIGPTCHGCGVIQNTDTDTEHRPMCTGLDLDCEKKSSRNIFKTGLRLVFY